MARIQIGIACASVLVLLTVIGCGMGPMGVTGLIIRNAPYFIGYADSYDSQVKQLASDHVKEVQVIGRGVRSEASPLIDEFNLTLHAVKFQQTPFHIVEIGSIAFSARATESDVNTFLNQRAHSGKVEVRDIHMSFTPRQVQTTVTIELDGRAVTAVSTGRLRQEGGTRVIYVPYTFTLDNAALPAAVQQDIVKQLNPVMELNGLKCIPQISLITLGEGTAIVTGTAALKNLP